MSRSPKKLVKLRIEVFSGVIEISDGKERLILTELDLFSKGLTLASEMTLYRRSNGRWYVRIWLNGQRRMLSTGETDYDRALLKIKETLESAADPKAASRQAPITFPQLVKEFELYIEKRWMQSTVENDRSRFKGLLAEFGNKSVTEITEHQLSNYLERRRDKTVVRIEEGVRRKQRINVATVNRELTTIKLIFKFAEERGYISNNPGLKIKPFPTMINHGEFNIGNERRSLTEDELDRLLSTCKQSANSILYEIVMVAVLSGLRKGELLRLTWDDVDFTRNRLRVRQSKTRSIFFKPMPDELRETLLALRDRYSHAHYVFSDQDGTTYGDWRRAFRTACRLAGLKDVCFHMLRHTCFSMLGDKGYSALEIKAYSGHKSLKMVERYTHISPEHVQKMANTIRLRSGAKVVQLKKET